MEDRVIEKGKIMQNEGWERILRMEGKGKIREWRAQGENSVSEGVKDEKDIGGGRMNEK